MNLNGYIVGNIHHLVDLLDYSSGHHVPRRCTFITKNIGLSKYSDLDDGQNSITHYYDCEYYYNLTYTVVLSLQT